MMFPTLLSREFIEEKLANLQKKKYNQFQWWRRYQYRNLLPDKSTMEAKILNGDYEHSDYYFQALHENYLLEDKIQSIKYYEDKLGDISLFRTRYKRLLEDYERDERELLQKLRRDLKNQFKISYEELDGIMEGFEGTTHELFLYVKELKK